MKTAAVLATLPIALIGAAVPQPANAAPATIRICHSGQSPASAQLLIFNVRDGRPMHPGGWLNAGQCTAQLSPASDVRIDASYVDQVRGRYNSGSYGGWVYRDIIDPATKPSGTTYHLQSRFL